MGIILLPIIIIVFAALFLIINLVSTISIMAQGGEIVYDEDVFQDYAVTAYYDNFKDETTMEDGLLLVIVNYEDNQELAYIACIGDNIDNEINDLFSSGGEFGETVETAVNIDNYKYSMSKDLAKVMDHMANEVELLGLNSPFIEGHDMLGAPSSKLIDKSGLDLNAQTIEASLLRFEEQTEIPVVLIVDTAENVFGKTMPVGNIIMAVITLGVIIFAICYLVSKIRRRNMINNDLGGANRIRVNSTGRRDNNDFDF